MQIAKRMRGQLRLLGLQEANSNVQRFHYTGSNAKVNLMQLLIQANKV